MAKVVSCVAPYGVGGLGQHLASVVEEARGANDLDRYYCGGPKPGDGAGEATTSAAAQLLVRLPPIRFRPDWRNHVSAVSFDRTVRRRLTRASTLGAFAGQSLATMERATELGYEFLELESPTTHIHHVSRQQQQAEKLGIERGWASAQHVKRVLREYEQADVIYVTSTLALESFVAAGVSNSRLKRRSLSVDARFVPAADRERDGVFRVVYVGALTAVKGVPILIEAFRRLPGEARLTLVGGWTTRAMRRYLMREMLRDSRINVAVGDPLPYLREADAYVHPSFQDGFGYGPMEAKACGVPVIVTEDTGMKEHVEEGVTGYVVPTGSWPPILERLKQLATR